MRLLKFSLALRREPDEARLESSVWMPAFMAAAAASECGGVCDVPGLREGSGAFAEAMRGCEGEAEGEGEGGSEFRSGIGMRCLPGFEHKARAGMTRRLGGIAYCGRSGGGVVERRGVRRRLGRRGAADVETLHQERDVRLPLARIHHPCIPSPILSERESGMAHCNGAHEARRRRPRACHWAMAPMAHLWEAGLEKDSERSSSSRSSTASLGRRRAMASACTESILRAHTPRPRHARGPSAMVKHNAKPPLDTPR